VLVIDDHRYETVAEMDRRPALGFARRSFKLERITVACRF